LAPRTLPTGADEAGGPPLKVLRDLGQPLYPPTLRRSGLLAALNDLVAPLTAVGVNVSLHLPDSLDLPSDTEALFYRVAQEAIRNTRSHGEATEVEIRVEQRSRDSVLTIVDNGRGFSLEADDEREQTSHFGLRLMRDLADHAGGTLEVLSSEGEGTSVCLEVPLP
jgi:two-component system, NarL family, sensor kinase